MIRHMTDTTESSAPTATWRTWFPAQVRLPDGRHLMRTKVYATNGGLLVYTLAPGGPALAFSSPILLDKTAEPGTDYASEQRGHQIVTVAGKVTVSRSGACSCSMRSLRAFSPVWAGIEAKWGE